MGRIEGWKVISAITGFSVRKLKRAEHWALPRIPVFRLGPGKTQVCADEDELTAWMKALRKAREA